MLYDFPHEIMHLIDLPLGLTFKYASNHTFSYHLYFTGKSF